MLLSLWLDVKAYYMVVAVLSAMRGIMALGHTDYGLTLSDPDLI